MIEMKIHGLAVDSTTRTPVVILVDSEEKRFLPIWIGIYEADAILVAFENFEIPRPMTHDLMKSMLETIGAEIDRIVISGLEKDTFFAKIHFLLGGKEYEVDSRPSDAIAMAVRFDAPIFVAEMVIMEATIMDKEKYEKEMKEFKDYLKDMKPSDFQDTKE